MDFFHQGALPPPRLIWHHVKCSGCFCSCLCIYMCPFIPFSRSSISSSIPLLPYFISLSSICFPPAPILADRKTSGFFQSHVVSWCSQYSQHGTQRRTDTNMLTPVQHHILQGECCWHKYKPTRAIPLWNDSGVSCMNTACKDPVYKHVSPNSSAQQNAGKA